MTSLSEEELQALENASYGIRLAARIVDTPCNEMNVDLFLNVRFNQFKLFIAFY